MDSVILKVSLREMTTQKPILRLPKDDLVNGDLQEVLTYTDKSLEHQDEMAAANVFNLGHICEVIRDGDTVIDLACGPAILLSQVAKFNPQVKFVGIDRSAEMLKHAQYFVNKQKVGNVDLCYGDITNLSFLADASCDVILSTFALHHLPDENALSAVFNEIARVLKPSGGIYAMEFGRLKSRQSIEDMAHRRLETQSSASTVNFVNSLYAAFSPDEFKKASKPLLNRSYFYKTSFIPVFVAFKSAIRQTRIAELRNVLNFMKDALPSFHKKDFVNLQLAFGMSGLRSSLV